MIVIMIFFGFLSYFGSKFIYWATRNLYDRTIIDLNIESFTGDNRFDDSLLVDELIVNAFSYNVMEPRLYSKYYAAANATIYDINLTTAVKASISTTYEFMPIKL